MTSGFMQKLLDSIICAFIARFSYRSFVVSVNVANMHTLELHRITIIFFTKKKNAFSSTRSTKLSTKYDLKNSVLVIFGQSLLLNSDKHRICVVYECSVKAGTCKPGALCKVVVLPLADYASDDTSAVSESKSSLSAALTCSL